MPHPNLMWWFRRVRIEPLNHRMRNGTQRNGGKRCQRCRQVRPLAVREHRQSAIVRMRQGFCRPGFGDLRIGSETSMGYGPNLAQGVLEEPLWPKFRCFMAVFGDNGGFRDVQ